MIHRWALRNDRTTNKEKKKTIRSLWLNLKFNASSEKDVKNHLVEETYVRELNLWWSA